MLKYKFYLSLMQLYFLWSLCSMNITIKGVLTPPLSYFCGFTFNGVFNNDCYNKAGLQSRSCILLIWMNEVTNQIKQIKSNYY